MQAWGEWVSVVSRDALAKVGGAYVVEPRLETEFDEPPIELQEWAAFILLLPGLGVPTIHVVGFNAKTGKGRVSSPVTAVNSSERCVLTQSGRVYHVLGEPGAAVICRFALERLTATWHADVIEDVTRALFDVVSLAATRPYLCPRYVH